MKAPLLTVAAIIALTGALVSCGDTEEIAPVPTATPVGQTVLTPSAAATPTIPADLPAAAEGYEWFVGPASGFGLPTYDVQLPVGWNSIYPGDSNPRWFTPPADKVGERFGPHILIKVTPLGPWTDQVFRFELPWQGGGLCGFLPDGEIASELGSWSLYQFKCPETETAYCAADDQQATITCTGKGGPSLLFFDGRAAEIRIGEYFCSIVVFRPGGEDEAEPAFQQAIRSFTLR